MCFSASASFAASGALTVASVATWRMATPRQKILAVIPFGFAVQQALEGMQWRSLARGLADPATAYAYLFFAFILWPLLMPVVVYMVDPARRRLLRWFVVGGSAISAYLLVLLAAQSLTIYPVCGSIRYEVIVPLSNAAVALYVLATCGPLIASSRKDLRWLGVVLFISAVVAAIVWTSAFTSVWCFFAALLSLLLVAIVYRSRTAEPALEQR